MSASDKITAISGEGRAPAEYIPGRNGKGAISPWRPGQSGNPSGRPATYRESRQALQDWASKRGVERIIELAESEDDRVASVVVLGAFERAFGKAKEYDPRTDAPPLPIDLSRLTSDDLRALQAIMARCAAAGMVELAGEAEGIEKTIEPGVVNES